MIDIIVPVYNTPISDLKRCLESIERQSFKDYRVYIIDDGSFDEVRNFLDEYAKDKENCIVKHVVNGGVSRARNIGIDSSNSLYLAFVDSDDTLEDNFLEEAFSLINGNDLDLVIGGYNEVKNSYVVKMRKCDEGLYIYDESNLNLVIDKVIKDHMLFIEEVYKRMLVEDDLRIKNAYIFRIFKSLFNLVDLIKSSDYSDGTLDKVLHNSMFSCLKDLDISSYINVSDKEVEFLNNYIASYI